MTLQHSSGRSIQKTSLSQVKLDSRDPAGQLSDLDGASRSIKSLPGLSILPGSSFSARFKAFLAPSKPATKVVLMRDGKVIYFGSGTEGRIPYRNGFDGNMEDVSAPMPLKLPDLKFKAWTPHVF